MPPILPALAQKRCDRSIGAPQSPRKGCSALACKSKDAGQCRDWRCKPTEDWGLLDHITEAARVEVHVGLDRDFRILDRPRSQTLIAWCATVIPRRNNRPGADEVGAAEYIDATCSGAPRLLEPLERGVDRLEEIAQKHHARPFAECSPERRTEALTELESAEPDVFAMVRDFTYEAYYGHPRVLAVLEAETGWHGTAPATGTSMVPFEERRLERVRSLPPRYRQLAEPNGVAS